VLKLVLTLTLGSRTFRLIAGSALVLTLVALTASLVVPML
jgi:hypothetical protein